MAVALAVPAAADQQIYTVTVGNSGSEFGYQDSGPAFGSVSPGGRIFTPGGSNFPITAMKSGFVDFAFEILSVVAQSSFRYLLVERTDGSFVRYNFDGGTYATPGGTRTLWTWGGGSNRAFTATSPATRRVIFVPRGG